MWLPDLQEVLNPSVGPEFVLSSLTLFVTMTLPRTFTTLLAPADTSCSPGPIYNLPEAQGQCLGWKIHN